MDSACVFSSTMPLCWMHTTLACPDPAGRGSGRFCEALQVTMVICYLQEATESAKAQRARIANSLDKVMCTVAHLHAAVSETSSAMRHQIYGFSNLGFVGAGRMETHGQLSK